MIGMLPSELSEALVDRRVIGGEGVRDSGGLNRPTPANSRFALPGVAKYPSARSKWSG